MSVSACAGAHCGVGSEQAERAIFAHCLMGAKRKAPEDSLTHTLTPKNSIVAHFGGTLLVVVSDSQDTLK